MKSNLTTFETAVLLAVIRQGKTADAASVYDTLQNETAGNLSFCAVIDALRRLTKGEYLTAWECSLRPGHRIRYYWVKDLGAGLMRATV